MIKIDSNTDFGKLIKDLRKEQGLTQSKLGEKDEISKIENNVREVSLKKLIKVIDTLGYQVIISKKYE